MNTNTSMVKYFFNGTNAVDGNYKYDNLPQDQKTKRELIGAGVHYFAGQITNQRFEASTRVVEIDEAIRITCLHDEVMRTSNFSEWNNLAEKSAKISVATTLTGIVGSVVAVGLGITSLVAFPPVILAAIPVAMIGIALLVVGKRTNTIMKAAQAERDKWMDPVAEAQQHRQSALQRGFYYIYESHTRKSFFHPDEIKALWFDLGQKEPVKNDIVSMNNFFKLNPFMQDVVACAFGNDIPEKVKDLCDSYNLIETQYKLIKSETKTQKSEIESEKFRLLLNINQDRARQLEPIERQHRTRESRLRSVRNVQMNAAIARNNLAYTSAKARVDAHFDAQERRVRAWAAQEIASIQYKEDQAVLRLYPALSELLKQFSQIQRNGLVNIYPHVEETVTAVHLERPTAPALEEFVPVYEAENNGPGISQDEFNEYLTPPKQ